MNLRRILPLFLVGSFFCIPVPAQEQVRRDPQALAMVSQSITALGGAVPPDSVATGNLVLVAGSKSENGTIRILTRGLDQTVEQIVTPEGSRAVIYSRGRATEMEGSSSRPLQLELVVTSQSAIFPFPLIASAYASPDTAFEYVGIETLNGSAAHRVRFWNTFHSTAKTKSQHLALFSGTDIWIDAVSWVPTKLSYAVRPTYGPGAVSIPVEIWYRHWRNVSGVLYPFHIEKSLNGTHWATIDIGTVLFSNGLSDNDFPTR